MKNIRYRQNDFSDFGGKYSFLLRYRQNETAINEIKPYFTLLVMRSAFSPEQPKNCLIF